MCQSISADFLSSGLSFGAMAEEAGSSQGAGLQVSTWGGGWGAGTGLRVQPSLCFSPGNEARRAMKPALSHLAVAQDHNSDPRPYSQCLFYHGNHKNPISCKHDFKHFK